MKSYVAFILAVGVVSAVAGDKLLTHGVLELRGDAQCVQGLRAASTPGQALRRPGFFVRHDDPGRRKACPGVEAVLQDRESDRVELALDQPPTASHVTFVPFHVFIDPHGKPLACYQVEIVATAGDVSLVGIEGGESAAFNKAPYYDLRALQQGNRIIIGAFTLAGDLPAGNTRVATLMVRVAGTVEPRFSARIQVAATSDATAIPAAVSVIRQSRAPAAETATASTIGGTR